MLGVTTYQNGYFIWLICLFHCIRTSFFYFQHQLINVGWTCYVELPLLPISLGFRECIWSCIIWFQSEIGHQQLKHKYGHQQFTKDFLDRTNKSPMSHIGQLLTLIEPYQRRYSTFQQLRGSISYSLGCIKHFNYKYKRFYNVNNQTPFSVDVRFSRKVVMFKL